MQIKKYFAPTLKEALEVMKKELGEEAIVLSTKVLEGNPKLRQEKMFEITAGIEDINDPNSQQANTENNIKEPKKNFQEELSQISQKIKTPKINNFNKNKIDAYKKNEKEEDWYSEKIKEILLQRDIEPKLVNRILTQFNQYAAFINQDNYEQYLISTISAMLPTSDFELKKKNKATIIGLIGPTGVGKTTCIAKLAVISKILHNLDVGLISIDTYRLGAIDQLKIFSEISNIELGIAYEPADLVKLIEKFKKKDIIFIDTAGRSQNNQNLLEDIKKFLSVIRLDEIYLVLNSSSATKTLLDVAEKFSIFDYNGLIFTKLDEAVTFGSLFNLVNTINVPIKYLTNGQTIPDDILGADPDFISNLIYTGQINQ